MIRVVKNKSGEYLTITTHLEIKKDDKSIYTPVFIQMDLTRLSTEDQIEVYRTGYKLFNHPLTVDRTKPKKTSQTWWQKLFARKK